MDFNVYSFDYNNRIRNLDIEAKGIVKSTKFFPVFNIDNSEYIFKPLSKTKPFTTPLFGISEVFWSNIINKYFDSNTEIYKLGICNNIDNPKYRKEGVFVKSLINNNQELINIYEYFNNNNDNNDNVNIKDYINYCGMFYDYTDIFKSNLFNNNELGEYLSLQVLLSILKADINYHYENVLLIKENNKYKLASQIDHEFSLFFLYVDNNPMHLCNINSYYNILKLKENYIPYYLANSHNIIKNIDYICLNYKDVVIDFINKLDKFIIEFYNEEFIIPNSDYFYPFSSDDYKIGIERYKKNNEKEALKLEKNIIRKEIDLIEYSKLIKQEILNNSVILENTLKSKVKKIN